jgi:hypothetical protein
MNQVPHTKSDGLPLSYADINSNEWDGNKIMNGEEIRIWKETVVIYVVFVLKGLLRKPRIYEGRLKSS